MMWGLEEPRAQCFGTMQVGCEPSWHMAVFTHLEALRAPQFSCFVKVPFCRHDSLNHWPLVIISDSSPSALPGWRLGVEFKVPTLWSCDWFLWWPAPTLKLFRGFGATSHHVNIYSGVVKRDLLLWLTKHTPLSPSLRITWNVKGSSRRRRKKRSKI